MAYKAYKNGYSSGSKSSYLDGLNLGNNGNNNTSSVSKPKKDNTEYPYYSFIPNDKAVPRQDTVSSPFQNSPYIPYKNGSINANNITNRYNGLFVKNGLTSSDFGNDNNVDKYSFLKNYLSSNSRKSKDDDDKDLGLYAYPDLSGFYQARLDSILGSLKTQRDNAIKGYEAQKAPIAEQYQDLRNQSEVERYKAEGKLRNALADRGALDSGAGRTEQLNLQTNYGNTLNKINKQEQSALDDINRAIADVNAQYAQQESEAKANMYNDVTDWLIGITPMSINLQPYLESASKSINDGSLANVGSNVGSNLSDGLSSLAGLNYLMNGNTGLNMSNVSNPNSDLYKLLRNAMSQRLISPFGLG